MLEYSHACLFPYCLWLLFHYSIRVKQLWQTPTISPVEHEILSEPLQKKFANTWLTISVSFPHFLFKTKLTHIYSHIFWINWEMNEGFPGGTNGKESAASARDARNASSIPGWERSPGVGNGTPPQYSCLENSMGRGARRPPIHRATKSWMWLST